MSIQVTNEFVYLKHYDFCVTMPPTDDSSSSNGLIISLGVVLGIAIIINIFLVLIVLCICVYMKTFNTDGLDR